MTPGTFGRRLTLTRTHTLSHPGLSNDVFSRSGNNIGCLPRIPLLPSNPCFESYPIIARWTRSLSHVVITYIIFWEATWQVPVLCMLGVTKDNKAAR